MPLLNRKITAAVLLVIMMAPVAITLLQQVKQARIQDQMQERLEQETLQQVTLSKDAIRWVKPGTEIMIGAEIFDIRKIEFTPDGRICLTGLFDTEESEFYEKLKGIPRGQDSDEQQRLARYFHYFPGQEICSIHISRPVIDLKSAPDFLYSENLPVNTQPILTPPPKADQNT